MMLALFGISTPVFWAGIVLIYLLSFRLGLFPIGGIIGTGIRWTTSPTPTCSTAC